METRTASEFVVYVVVPGGGIDAETGGQYDTIEQALTEANELAEIGLKPNSQVVIEAVDGDSEVTADSVIGGMVVWTKRN